MFGAMNVIGPAQAKLYAWRMQGSVFAGVVVKLGLRWAASGERMVSAGSVPIVEEARHHKNNFAHSPIYPTDVVPYRPYADLILDATAHPAGGASTVMPRLVLERGGRPVIDKRLLVEAATGPVPLRWEHTHRGADNPFGGSEARVTDPRRPHAPAGFGPEPLVVQRQRFPKAPDGLVELPAGTSAEVFQAAPADQRCEHFDGAEWLTLEGMHPELAHLRLGLPALRGHAVVAEAPATTWAPLRMVADLLAVQPASSTAVMTWRGWLALPSAQALRRLRWAVTVAGPDETVAWPTVAEVAGAPSAGRPAAAPPSAGETVEGAAPIGAASPYAISAPGSARAAEAPLPGAPWEASPAPVVVKPQPGDTTAEPVAQADPFAASPPSDAAATVGVHTEEPSTRRPEDPFATTDAQPAPSPDPANELESATLEEPESGERRELEQAAADAATKRREEAEADALRREVAAREAEDRARFEAEEEQRRRQDERQARLAAERERRARMMDRLYGFKLQDP